MAQHFRYFSKKIIAAGKNYKVPLNEISDKRRNKALFSSYINSYAADYVAKPKLKITTKDMLPADVPPVPLLFLKPASAFITEGENIKTPSGCSDLQHEVELAVVIGKRMNKQTNGNVFDYIAGYALALDMTANDFLSSARKNGGPWFISKGFDSSCPVSNLISKSQLADPHNVDIWCTVNGEIKQKENTSSMIFRIPQLLRYASNFVTLEPGDVLLTGTPAGISTVKSGDKIEAGLGEIVKMKFAVE